MRVISRIFIYDIDVFIDVFSFFISTCVYFPFYASLDSFISEIVKICARRRQGYLMIVEELLSLAKCKACWWTPTVPL